MVSSDPISKQMKFKKNTDMKHKKKNKKKKERYAAESAKSGWIYR